MDELLQDFLAESAEHLEAAGAQIVAFERDPSDARLIADVFRFVHTIKGTCGFLGLARLAKVAHAAESSLGRLRDGAAATPELVSLILAAVGSTGSSSFWASWSVASRSQRATTPISSPS